MSIYCGHEHISADLEDGGHRCDVCDATIKIKVVEEDPPMEDEQTTGVRERIQEMAKVLGLAEGGGDQQTATWALIKDLEAIEQLLPLPEHHVPIKVIFEQHKK